MFRFILALILLFVVYQIVIQNCDKSDSTTKSSSSEGTPAFSIVKKQSTETKAKPQAPSADFGGLNINDPYDICYALACLTTSIAYYAADQYCTVTVAIDNENKTTRIRASGLELAGDLSTFPDYDRYFVPKNIASFLANISFDSASPSGEVVKTFKYTVSSIRITEHLNKGASLVMGRPYIFHLNTSYWGNNRNNKYVEFTVAD